MMNTDNEIKTIVETENLDIENKTEENINITENAEETKINYLKPDKIFAFLSIAIGFMLIKLVFWGGLGFGSAIFFTAVTTFCLVYFKLSDIKFDNGDKIRFVMLYLSSINFAIFDFSALKFYNFLFAGILLLYTCFCITRHDREKENMPSDLNTALFKMPTYKMGACCGAISQSVSKTKFGTNIKYVIAGLFIAMPVFFVVLTLLSSADIMFASIFESIFKNISENSLFNIIQFLMAIPVGFMIFSVLYANKTRAEKDELFPTPKFKGFFNPIIIYSAILPIMLLYVIFFVSQLGYFFSAFQSVLPQGYSYAEYAREGFFELCAVATINLFIIIVSYAVVKKENNKAPNGIKITICTLSVMTIMLIVTALSKMVMYISNFGLSRLRFYTSWFMVLLMLLFIYIIVKQFKEDFRLYFTISATFCIMFLSLIYCNVDYITARVNAQMYYSGYSDEVDVHMLDNMSDAVVPVLEELRDNGYKPELIDKLLVEDDQSRYNNWCEKSIVSLLY